MSENPSPFARGLLVAVLAVGVLGFGAMGLCGGFFTFSLLSDLFLSGHGGAIAPLALCLPFLIGGISLVLVCLSKIRRLLRKPQPEGETP
ncbi:hypothetical protein [Roseateles sp.]|uniref:hypothetical protein n=1 Tax=Roseateles sp. TaxID=1971397 RepID=UPI0032665584